MTENDWIGKRITEAKAETPTIAPAVMARLEELLAGPLSAGTLPKGDLARIAKELIADMASVPPQATAK